MQLRTDFLDFYDHWFDRVGEVFERFSTGGMNRGDMLHYLNENGEKTPTFGIVSDLQSLDIKDVVVYLDTMAHRSEGKLKMAYKEAMEFYPGHLCSEYIPCAEGFATTMRRLQIGNVCFWLRYRSNDAWRSNCGNVSIDVIERIKKNHPSISLPLFAIDYIVKDQTLLAVDFNIAPQLKGTGVEDQLSAKEVVELIINHKKS